MEQYIVSARKYRPATFESVVGQKAVTNTLKNAIRNNQLAQAFLFCGPRGVGKTTCARILAKAVNAADIDNIHLEEQDEFNIIELDAASNNSVEDIRSLIEQVRIPPAAGKKYKTYIIDEVHMLSSSAFNAFLKTLEEPPSYAIFILATTEKHKILPTILSRCQVFDFQRIQIQHMVDHLADIAAKESIAAEPDALHIIAQKADGGLRDALSMFDQLATFTGRNLTYSAVIENLNVLDYDYYFKVTQSIIDQQIPQALLIYSEIMEKGFDGQHFLVGLGEHFRNLLVCKDSQTLKLLDVGETIKTRYKEQAEAISLPLLLHGLDRINQADINYRQSKNQKLLVELTLMQLCSLQYQEGEKKNDIRIIPAANYRNTAQQITPAPVKEVPKTIHTDAPVIARTPEPPAPAGSPAATPPKVPGKLGLSIKSIVNKPAESATGTKEEILNASRDDFSQEQLNETWKAYAEEIRKKQKESFYSTMTIRKPVLGENFRIVYAIDNTVQKMDFERELPDLMEHLRKKLNNYAITLELELNKNQQKNNFYTDNDKLEAIVKQHPHVKDLVKKLGLETDF